jgi:hypothetical protein
MNDRIIPAPYATIYEMPFPAQDNYVLTLED